MFKILFSLLVSFCSLFSYAQTSKDQAIELKTCIINVEAGIFKATTTILMEFYNPNNKVMDGQYDFALQQGQVITGFELDINGKLREGVIVDKKKGRVAYENTIRRRIDPGLLEMTAGDNYRVRIYPMPATGTRKIKIIISQVLDVKSDAVQYFLPLNNTQPVNEFSATIKITGDGAIPKTGEGLLEKLPFFKNKDGYSLVIKKKSTLLNRPLAFEIPLLKKTITAVLKNGSYNIFATHIKLKDTVSTASEMKGAIIFWDVSASASKRNQKKEIEFLEKFITQKRISTITIITFSNAIHNVKEFQTNKFTSIINFLEEQHADGGTQLGVLDCNNYNSEAFLLFSDGLSNFGDNQIKTGNKMLLTINSSPVANHSLLKSLAERTGGNYIDLTTITATNAIKEIINSTLQLLNVSQDGKAIQHSLQLPIKISQWLTISGISPENKKDIEFTFGRQGIPLYVEKINFTMPDNKADSQLNEVYLLQQFASLQSGVMNIEAITAFAQQNEFVSSTTSFIVLDNIDDYIEHGIVPPAELHEEYSKKLYVVNQKAKDLSTSMENEELDNLRKAALLYNDRIKWWGAPNDMIKTDQIQIKQTQLIVKGSAKAEDNISGNKSDQFNSSFKNSSGLEEVVVTGYGSQRRRSVTGSVTRINASQINSGANNISQALQGRVAGLQVIRSASPGAADQIIIRGTSSIAGGEPLYVLDGTAGDAAMASLINVSDIESITVLKDIQASALYGSRAYNGAIVIETKSGSNSSRQSKGIVRYKDQEDVDYVSILKDQDAKLIYSTYLQMKKDYVTETAFFADAAQVLFEAGEKYLALRTLSNMTELDKENHQQLRGMGYILESWGMYAEAIDVYKKVLLIKDEEPQSYRDLALAYERNGQSKEAVDILYQVITKNFYQYEDRYRGIKSLLLNEMNAIINRNINLMCDQEISPTIIKPLPVDLRVVIDWNKDETDIDLHITDPNGEECFYGHKQTKSGGRLSEDFTQGNGPEEFEVKDVLKGRYHISVNYFGDRYQKEQVSPYIKLTVYKNYGKSNQSVTTEVFNLLNQNGKIEIGSVKF